MTQHELVIFALQLSTMLIVALASGRLAAAVRFPVVLGELVGGVVLGPTVFGALFPGLHGWLFAPAAVTVSAGRDGIVRLAVLLFLFSAGLEMDLERMVRVGTRVIWISLSGIVVPMALGMGLVYAYPGLWGPAAMHGTFLFALFIGTALSISALPVIARILMDLKLLSGTLGSTVMAAATLDDLVGWSLFGILLGKISGEFSRWSIWVSAGVLAGMLLLLLGGRWMGVRARGWVWLRGDRSEVAIGIAVATLLVAAAGAEAVGLDVTLGAFQAGVLVGCFQFLRRPAARAYRQFVMGFFAPLYFVSIGLKADFAAHFDLSLVAVVIAVACAAKIGGVSLGAGLGRVPAREALAIGFGMNARGAMEMILASVALERGLIDLRIYVALITMAMVTSAISAPFIQRLAQHGADQKVEGSTVPLLLPGRADP